MQRKFKRNFQGGMGTGYTTSDEVWCHFKPTMEQLEKWIKEEGRGEARIDEKSAVQGDTDLSTDSDGDRSKNGGAIGLSDADEDERVNDMEAKTASQNSKDTVSRKQEKIVEFPQDNSSEDAAYSARTYMPAEDGSYHSSCT